jgi:hypothetical protein
MTSRLLTLVAAALIAGCTAAESDAPAERAPAVADRPSAEGPSACNADDTLTVDGGAGPRPLILRDAVAVPRIRFNEQTDSGDVAKPGLTVCLADFPLDADPWARPPAHGGAKIELRLFTGDNAPLEAGVYRSAARGRLQMGPILYLDGETHPFLFPRIGRVTIHRLDSARVCGELAVETISGLALRGAFDAPVVAEPER